MSPACPIVIRLLLQRAQHLDQRGEVKRREHQVQVGAPQPPNKKAAIKGKGKGKGQIPRGGEQTHAKGLGEKKVKGVEAKCAEEERLKG